MNGTNIAIILAKRLNNLGFIVHRYNSVTTSSIYLKLDYGVCCGIRIADHPGKKKYHYRFNVMKDYRGERAILYDGLPSYFFDFSELEIVIKAVQEERQKKINEYGMNNYKSFIDINSKDQFYKRFTKMEGENYGESNKNVKNIDVKKK